MKNIGAKNKIVESIEKKSGRPLQNLIHASDSKETAAKEIPRFFKDSELMKYELNKEWLYASDE